MDRRIGFDNKTNEPTCLPRGMRCSEHETNRYVYRYIGHESSVGVCFAKCLHVLVLAFAATRRQVALRAFYRASRPSC